VFSPACLHLRAKEVAPIGMEEFQIFYEIKSRRSAPFCLPGYSRARSPACEDPFKLTCRGRLNWSTVLEHGLSKGRHISCKAGSRPRVAFCGSLSVWSRTYVRVIAIV
jgi:hypothetical protein